MGEKVQEIELSLNILQHSVSEIEKQTSTRQDDIRQETNNIINKFNGAISWWLLLLGIVCGFAPLVLAYLNHKNDSEYIKQLNSNYLEALQKLKEHEEKIKDKLTKLENKKEEFERSEKKRNEELTSTRKKLELLHTFVYVASFTTKSQFQTSPERNRIVDKLLFELINNSLKCIKFDGEKTYISDDVDILYWVMTSIEGITLLAPYQTDILKLRRMNDIVLVKVPQHHDLMFLSFHCSVIISNDTIRITQKYHLYQMIPMYFTKFDYVISICEHSCSLLDVCAILEYIPLVL